MKTLIALTILALTLHLSNGQAAYTKRNYIGLAYCDNGVKVVSDTCYMLYSDAEMNVMSKCIPAQRYINTIVYNFTKYDECIKFRQDFLNSFTNTFTQAQTIVNNANKIIKQDQLLGKNAKNDNNINVNYNLAQVMEAADKIGNATCGCKQIVDKIIDYFIENDNENGICNAFVESQLDKFPDVCPSVKVKILNFFLEKACDIVQDTVYSVANRMVIEPVCNQVENIVSFAFRIEKKHLSTSPAEYKDKASQLACAALFCRNPDSKICVKATEFEPKGVWKNALKLLGVCPKLKLNSESNSAGGFSMSMLGLGVGASLLMAI